MNAQIFLPLSIAMSTIAYFLAARWYILPRLNGETALKIVKPILLLHTFRHIGLAFLIPGVTAEALDPRFSEPAAYGDLLAGVLAFAALIALSRNPRAGIALSLIFNIVGAADLLNALFQGFMHTPNGALGAMYFIPAMVVPLLLVTHYVLFIALAKAKSVRA